MFTFGEWRQLQRSLDEGLDDNALITWHSGIGLSVGYTSLELNTFLKMVWCSCFAPLQKVTAAVTKQFNADCFQKASATYFTSLFLHILSVFRIRWNTHFLSVPSETCITAMNIFDYFQPKVMYIIREISGGLFFKMWTPTLSVS